ncbi:MAG: hypothetical protein KatS3mg105_3372 [Gemmatales bacterium]|nr:MAG: hypothetical protein KatS3mg105_3372 [Gemmatales bacterium]
MRGVHDMGGLPAGPIDRREHELSYFEKRVNALMYLLSKRGVMNVHELRCGIEALGEGKYDNLTYYERWIMSIADNLVRKGVITIDELGRKLAELEDCYAP